MSMTQLGYGEYISIPKATFGDVLEQVKSALKEEGFGILAEMDIGATLSKKLEIEFRRYVVLGACLPEVAKEALEMEPHIGLLLPCNVAVQESEQGVMVSVVHPKALLSLAYRSDLLSAAIAVERRLRRVLDRFKES